MNESIVKARWRICEEDRSRTADWSKQLDVPRLVAHLLMHRGIDSIDAARRYLDPTIEQLSDPMELIDMDAAVERITQARDRGERVMIFGDYDVDGISGTAALYLTLRDFGIDHCYWGLPSRATDGYGLRVERVQQAKADGVDLIITVDNGINARDAAQAAKQCGIDLIITDHHQIEGPLPEATAIINPVRHDPPGPCDQASGAAVAYQLGRGLTGGGDTIDLVALGTVADIVPLRGENRVLVSAGIDRIRRNPRVGIEALVAVSGARISELTSENIAFQIAPRINAAGRIKDSALALELLLTSSKIDAERMARELNQTNEERRELDRTILEEVVEELDRTLTPQQQSIVLASRHWHPGVIGIVASQLVSRYRRPTMLIAIDEDGVGRGSARCAPEFGMVEALSACSEHLERFGGHAAAAGITISESDIEAFRQDFEREAQRRCPEGPRGEILGIDAMVSLSEIDPVLVRNIERLEPFGHGNRPPIFCSFGVQPIPNSLRILRGGHLKLQVRQGDTVLSAIGFRMEDRIGPRDAQGLLDIAFTPQFNTWRGETTVQLLLKDIRSAGN